MSGLTLALFGEAVAGSAQQVGRTYRVGILSSTDPARPNENYVVFRERLREFGWSEGRNLAVEGRYIGPDRERLAVAARELVSLHLDLILAAGGAEAPQAAAAATKSIPIVFVIADDPVRLGLVKSFSHPGANITGLSSMNAELDDKRLALLKEALPRLRRVGAIWNPADPSGSSVIRATERTARALNVQLTPLAVQGPDDVSGAIGAAKKKGIDAVMVLGIPTLFLQQHRIAELATSARLPTVSAWRQLPEAGGLLSYGANIRAMFRRAADITDKILKGAKPTQYPVERPTKFDLVVNLKTAKALGLTIPQSLLLRADEVIQ
ncbi:MAG TPA: ABC transporter substrate-binding protein [Candidatus Dormibacteraeota bacterium]|nr:ABC transporter substrate-binding protein [Candidatus Dormibacteraeota bacterium]